MIKYDNTAFSRFYAATDLSSTTKPAVELCCVCLEPLDSRWYGCYRCSTLNHTSCKAATAYVCLCNVGDL